MTRFIDIEDMRILVGLSGVAKFISLLVDYIEQDFRRWPEFDKTPRVASHSDIGVIELMPTADTNLYGFKYVNGHPQNALHNQLTVMAFGALAETATGYPLLLSEFTLATALRTAATSVLGAKYLMRSNARKMAVIGNGAQSEFQIIGFNEVLGFTDFWLYDVDNSATEKLIGNLNTYPGIRLHFCRSVDEAVSHVDVITTITADKSYANIIAAYQVKPGMHLNAVGGDCPGKTELDADILNNADVFVEFTPQSRIEGEIQQMPTDFAVTELWEVINAQKTGRRSDDAVTVFDSVGFAIEDFSALRLINDIAKQHNIGSNIALVPAPANPRDLYSLLARPE
ncbi:ornithine cyclodeaminase [Serratia ficaria]|uniref:Ornithine cyclodeaminase n=1 Tax=Serratia ficaria TaxID=61651 RepID=A0A240AMB7_SERFI|nr:ornithine cyclodeaminase [Serratia ficaria]REF41999.1 ornithine cyclodeaminase [Serratia ficaria]CAI0942527.1 ornithine cyclodeaminase [Serratia ficaria]CAI0958453.1 ornithine cyclodeaminase [Serratia ficaria]CAI1038440.1 ornithine cyclodeaminase [Serratia ficaria]CAI2063822.1 ornithine cyclodeaminase [Serratia ficaria]